jgi:GNAT superfamily N-acetyltransferase
MSEYEFAKSKETVVKWVEEHPFLDAVILGASSVGVALVTRGKGAAIFEKGDELLPNLSMSGVAQERAVASGGEGALKAEGVKIVPLTQENLSAAIAAGKDGFSYGGPFLTPARDFRASLDTRLNPARISMDPKVEMNARYFVALDAKGNVLGTTGVYETGKDQSEAAWLGWMSVRKEARGQGIGQKLVDFSIDQARAAGKQYLRLYTSTAEGEAAAQTLYEKNGFALVGAEPHTIPRVVQRIFGEKDPLKILFRERELNPELNPAAKPDS